MERISLIRRIMFMSARDRMKLARKGDREARSILIRDPNRVVATAVINNPRISDKEAENIATMRTVSAEVLRLIALNRNWARSYTIVHNLARNPRSPIPTVIGILPRIRHEGPFRPLSEPQTFQKLCDARRFGLAKPRSGISSIDFLEAPRSG